MFGGEIATAFVRLRPNTEGFGAAVTEGIRGGLAEAQAAVAETTRANVTSTRTAIDANDQLRASYTTLGSGARSGLAGVDAAVQTLAETATTFARRVEEAFTGIATSAEVMGEKVRAGLVGGVRRGANESEGFLSRMKSRFLNVGTLIGVGFGADIALHFVKGISQSAASVQKSVETIKATFGPEAAKVIVGFGDTVAAKLGISAELADATSAKFGILFKNLNIGVAPAAQMTVNLEKLAGVLSAVRGVDPSLALQRITLAMLGNTRSLKQLGLAVDPTQEKLQAFKMGLISTVNDALTPGVRAQAVYALAVQHLGEFQRLAARHAGDLANQQRRLSAEWSNAKDQIGTALLPVFTRYTTHLADWLEKMIHSGELQRDMNGVLHAGAGAFAAIRLMIAPVVAALRDLSGALGGARNLVLAFIAAWAASKILGIANTIRVSMVSALTTLRTNIATAKGESEGLWATMKAGAIGTGLTIKAALITTGIGALIVAIGLVTAYVLTHWKQVKLFTVDLAHSLGAIWAGLKDVLIGTAKVIGGSMATSLTLPFIALLEAASKVTGFLDKLHIHIGGAVKTALDGLKSVTTGLVTDGAQQVAEGGAAIGHAFASSWQKSVRDATTGTTADPSAKRTLYGVGKDLGNSLGQGMADVLAQRRAGIAAAQQKLAQAVQAASASVQTAKAQVAKTIHDTNAQIAAMIQAGDQKVYSAAVNAAKNLNTIGGTLAAAITKFLTKGGGTANLRHTPLGEQLARVRAAIASGHGGSELISSATELAAQLQQQQVNQGQLKDKVTGHVKNLTDQLNQGRITIQQFHTRLLNYLKSLGVSYAAVGKTLGKAQADAYQAEIAAVLKQAGIIVAEPHKLRQRLERAHAGLAPKIIDVQDVRAQEDRKIANARAKAEERIAAARHHEVMAEAAASRKIQSATLTETKQVAKYTGQVAANTRPRRSHTKSTGANKGKTAHGARQHATTGSGFVTDTLGG